MKPTPCACENCNWTGPEAALDPINEQGIFERVSPGEIMPYGCCPKCGALAHAVEPDRLTLDGIIRDALAYEAEEFDGPADLDLSVSGADLVDWFTDWRQRARKALKTVEPSSAVGKARLGETYLRRARDLLKGAGATRAVERVRLAITSAGGAVRHAQGKASRIPS